MLTQGVPSKLTQGLPSKLTHCVPSELAVIERRGENTTSCAALLRSLPLVDSFNKVAEIARAIADVTVLAFRLLLALENNTGCFFLYIFRFSLSMPVSI